MMKRTISLLLSLAMVLSLMPTNFHVFAEGIPAEEVVAEAPVETTPEETLAIEETVPVEEAENYDAYGTILLSGRCGTNLSWYLYSNGELVISGWGPMDDYKYNTMPWNIADNRSNIKTITIEHGVTSIGNYAFAACPNLTSVTMPSTVTSIGNAAFSACSSLYVLDIGKNVATIGMSAFSNCTSLTQVTLGESLTSIGDYAFDSTRMMDLVFPETLTSIGSWVFLNCYSLKYLSFKGNAPSFGSGTFSHFYGQVFYHTNDSTWTENVRQNYGGEVEWIASDPLIISKGTCGRYAEWVLTEDGLLTISGTGAMNDYPLGYIPWNEHQRDIKNVAIEKGITGIGLYAFRNCSYLTSLVVPESVTNISASAFEYSSIREITFEGDAPTFGENAFKGKVITVHYPANNATWTEEVRQNYGGTITWVADEVTVAEGTCGDNLTWKLTESGTLTISGQGRMQLYDTATAPWYGYREWIQKVVIEDGVTSIGYGAFYYCTNMTSVEIPDSVTVIDPFAFTMCQSLTEIRFPETLTTIGRAAFSTCKSLTGVTIPDSVTRVEEAAFIGCEALTDVTIGKGVSYLCCTAFMRCSGLTEFKISPENAHYCVSEDGVLFNKDMTYLVSYPAGKAGAYTVPGTVTEIGYCAFESCKSLTSVTIPASVEQIDESAFYNTGLKEVHFEGDAPELIATYVGDHYWFRHYAGLTLPVYYPADNATWTDEAKAAFNESTLKWVAYEEETYLAKGTCGENLKWTLTEEGVMTISGQGEMQLYGNGSVPWYDYRERIRTVVIEDGVTEIGYGAFQYCTNLTSVEIPDSVTSIGYLAFASCALLEVNIPVSVTRISGRAFDGCDKLVSVNIPEGITQIIGYTFYDCSELAEIVLPDGLTRIDIGAFKYCNNLKTVVLPATVDTIMDDAFAFTEISEVYYGGSKDQYSALGVYRPKVTDFVHYNCTAPESHWDEKTVEGTCMESGYTCEGCTCGYERNKVETGKAPHLFDENGVCQSCGLIGGTCGENLEWTLTEDGVLTISGTGTMTDYDLSSSTPWYAYRYAVKTVILENGVTSIGDDAFSQCSNLSSVNFGNSVTDIGKFAFLGCGLTSVEIPDSVISIGKDAFSQCSSLTNVKIGNSVTSVGDYAFYLCSNLTAIEVDAANPSYSSDAYGVLFNKDKTTLVCCPGGKIGTYMIPDSVISIAWYAFYSCRGLTNVIIGNSVTSIDSYAFSRCSSLTSVEIPDSVTSISSAFSECTSLTSVKLGKSVGQIDGMAFGDCNSLMEIVVDEENPHYSSDADGVLFNKDKTRLVCWPGGKSGVYTIPDSVITIGQFAFFACDGLTSVKIPNSVTNIQKKAFYDCNNLTNVEISDSVTRISSNAFCCCTSLSSIEIPDSVTYIEIHAFAECSSLVEITFKGDAPGFGNNAFYNVTATAYYPAGNASWTEEVRQNYGGTITWVAYVEETIVAEGTCGEELKWTLSESGVLHVSGIGAMTDYATASESPWYDYRTSITKVVLGDGVTSVGDRAFYNCTALTDVTIGNKVATIGGYAFRGCTALVSVTIPASVTEIKGSAFRTCSALEEVTFLGNAPTMGTYVFTDCHENLTLNCYEGSTGFDVAPWTDWKVVVNHVGQWIVDKEATCTTDGSRHIDCAYCGTIITEIIVGSHDYVDGICSVCNEVKLIASGEFRNGGWKLDIFGTLTIYGTGVMDGKPWRSYEEDIVHVIIEDGITDITPHAFQGCTNLVDIIIPDSVTKIQNYAFEGCSSLREVDIPEGVLEIENDTFMNCTSLTRVSIPESVTIIDSSAFDGCSSLADVTIPESVETIELYAFRNCSSLAELVIPETVTSIGYAAFYGCTGLVNVTIPNSVTSLGDSVFQGCTSLTRVDIPDSVTSLGASAFKECSGLTQVTIGKGVTELGAYTFSHCRNLAAIVIPEGVTSIGNSAFSFCSALTELTIVSCVTTIDEYAFNRCAGLKEIRIPYSLTMICNEAFYGCEALKDVYITDPNAWCRVNFKGSYSEPGTYAERLHILDEAGKEVTEVVLDESVTTIPFYAFKGSSIVSITLPESVTSIEYAAFQNCASLSEIVIPKSLKTVDNFAFSGCTGLTNVYITDLAAWVSIAYDDIYSHPFYTTSRNGNSNKLYLNGELVTDLVIPDTVTEIQDYAFVGCSSLRSVVVPDSVTRMNNAVFNGCNNLESLTIPFVGIAPNSDEVYGYHDPFGYIFGTSAYEGGVKTKQYFFVFGYDNSCDYYIPASLAKVTVTGDSILDRAFYNCNNLKEIVIEDGVGGIGSQAFRGCTSLEKVTMGSGVTEIGELAFYGLINLSDVTFGANVTEIGKQAFYGCTGLTEIAIPNSVTNIGESAFSGCTGLTEIAISSSITTIDNYVFYNCAGLTEIAIPNGVTTIGSSAFSGCTGLTEITIPSSVTTIGQYAFSNCTALENVYITDPNAWCKIISDGSFSNLMYYAKHLHILDEEGNEVTDVILEDTVTVIPDCAFRNAQIASITIPNSVTTIDSNSFEGCTSLTNVTIGTGVTTIGWRAFYGCTGLTEITFEGNAPAFASSNVFSNVKATAYYPAGNETWTEAVRQNYGGKITWKLYCPDEHTEVVDKAVEATCTTDGLTEGKHCSVCNEVIVVQEVVPALGHSTVEVPGVEPTVDAAGNIPHFSCEACGKLFAEAEAETELKPEDVVLDKLPCGAMVGGSHYGTVEQALAAAKPGDVVTLTADAVAGNLFVPVGVTLDLAEYSLTADYLFGVKGTFLTGTPEKAKLMVPKDNVILAQDGYVNAKGQYVLPIWDPASNCFQFSLFVVNTDTSKNRGLKINEAAEEIRFQFKHQATSNLNSLLLADGASDNEMSIVIRLSWTNDQGTAHQDFVYNDNQVAKVTGSYDYTFVLTGYSALNINLDTLVVQAMVITNSGATAFGTAWTQLMLK